MENLDRVFNNGKLKRFILDQETDEYFLENGFKYDTWFDELGLYTGVWSECKTFFTRIYIFKDRIFFYKEYECGGMIMETEDFFDLSSFDDYLEQIKQSIEWFDFD